jgi:hypothetical protein
MSPLEKELETALMDLYEKWKRYMRPKNRFRGMVLPGNAKLYKGPVGTVKYLLTGAPSFGFTDLVNAKQLQVTVEWLVLHPKWLPLFTDQELDIARTRIRKVLEAS